MQPEVTSATVDYKEASAVVWTTDEAKGTQGWQKQYGEKLAKHLGTCGFESRVQGNGCIFFPTLGRSVDTLKYLSSYDSVPYIFTDKHRTIK